MNRCLGNIDNGLCLGGVIHHISEVTDQFGGFFSVPVPKCEIIILSVSADLGFKVQMIEQFYQGNNYHLTYDKIEDISFWLKAACYNIHLL